MGGDGCSSVTRYGVYDLAADEGWVSVITSETAEFAVNTIISWCEHLGKRC